MFRNALFSLFFIFLAVSFLPTRGIVAAGRAARANASADEFEIYRLVNQERGRRRMNELEWDDRLADMARSYSKKMARELFFDHYDGNGLTVVDRANDLKIKGWRRIGENLFFVNGITRFSDFTVRGWLNSPSHRQNMLDRSWTATGIGVARSRDGSIYVTQVFVQY